MPGGAREALRVCVPTIGDTSIHIQEGDVIATRGRSLLSRVIALLNGGVSHVGIVLCFYGELYVAQSVRTANPSSVRVLRIGGVAPQVGVQAISLDTDLASSATARAWVYRRDFSAEQLATLRDAVKKTYGHPYEDTLQDLCCMCCPLPRASAQSYVCSEFLAHIMSEAHVWTSRVNVSPHRVLSLFSRLGEIDLGRLGHEITPSSCDPPPFVPTRIVRRTRG